MNRAEQRRNAYGQAFDAHYAQALRLAGMLYGNRPAAEDAVGDAFAKTWRHYRDEDIPALWPYVRSAILNDFRSALRRRVHERKSIEREKREGRFASPDHAQAQAENAALIAALQELPASQRAIVVLRYLDDLSEQQTANALGCSVGNVKSQLSRGLEALRVLLAHERIEEVQS